MEHDGRPDVVEYGPRSPQPPWERRSVPEPVAADPYLAATVALLNLTGLGLGYALLRRWVAMGVCLVATAVLLLVVLPVRPDGTPTVLVAAYLVLIGVTVVHGAVQGLEAPRRPRPAAAPAGLIVSVALLLVPTTGLSWYSETVQHQLLDRLAGADRLVRQAQGEPFATARPQFHRALRTYAYLLERHPASRAARRVPDRLRAYYAAVGAPYAKRRYCDAIAPLHDLRTVPRSVDREHLGSLVTWPDDRLPTSLLECGKGKLGTDPLVTSKGGDLYELLTAFPRSKAAGRVEPAIRAAVGAAAGQLGGHDPCPAAGRLRTLRVQVSTLLDHRRTKTTPLARDRDAIDGHVRDGTYLCGVDQYKDGAFGSALATLNGFVATYRDDKRVPLARKIAIAAEIAVKLPAAGRHLPTTASGGSVRLTFYNDSPFRKRVLYTGKVTGSLTVGSCDSCYEYLDTQMARRFACSPGRHYPRTSVRLPAGTVYLLQQSLDSGIRPYAGSVKLHGGGLSLCLYTVRS
ncbi:MAG TPA: hypothetical protein VF053_15575 [Streptosporangiales bacterium]